MGVERQARGVGNSAHQGLHFSRRGDAVDRNRGLLPPWAGIRGEDVALGIHRRIADRVQIASQQAGDFETNRIARLSVLPDLEPPGLHILGYAHDHAVGTAEQNGSLDPVEHGHRQARAHGAQLGSAHLDFTAWKRSIRHRGIDPG